MTTDPKDERSEPATLDSVNRLITAEHDPLGAIRRRDETIGRLTRERDLALGSERILSQMLGECAEMLGLDATTHAPTDIAPTIEVWRETVARLTSFERAAKESVEIMRRAHAETIARLTAERDEAIHHAGEWLVAECEAQNQVTQLKNELDAALGSECILSQMMGECAQLLGLDAAKNSPEDIAPTIEVWRENISTLRAELSAAREARDLIQRDLNIRATQLVEELSAANEAREKAERELTYHACSLCGFTHWGRCDESLATAIKQRDSLKAALEKERAKAERLKTRIDNAHRAMGYDPKQGCDLAECLAALIGQRGNLRRQLAEAKEAQERSDTAMRDCCLVFDFDPSDGEGTSPEEVAQIVQTGVEELKTELAQWQAVAGKKDAALEAFRTYCRQIDRPPYYALYAQVEDALSTPPPTALLDELERAKAHSRPPAWL